MAWWPGPGYNRYVMTVNDRQTRRQLEHLVLLLQKSGHALAAYLVQPQAGEDEVELLLLVPDEDLATLGDRIAEVTGAYLAVIPDTEPHTFRLPGPAGLPGPRLRAFPASRRSDFLARAVSRPGQVLFDHPGIFTRDRPSGFLNRF